MAKIESKVSQSSEQDIMQHASQSEQQTLHTEKRIKPRYPSWPTSKPGVPSTLPLAGMRSVNPFRPEQVTQIGSSQEVGLSSVDSSQRSMSGVSTHDLTSIDQPKHVLDILGKCKRRL